MRRILRPSTSPLARPSRWTALRRAAVALAGPTARRWWRGRSGPRQRNRRA
jgi:hypothetical protein